MIKAVLFDLDGTLLDRDETFRGYLRSQVQRLSALIPAAQADRYVERTMELDRHGHELRTALFEAIAGELSLEEGVGMRLYEDFRDVFPEVCVPFPGAAETIEALSALGFRIGLITNGAQRTQQRKLDRLGFTSCFETLLISEVEGVQKPDSEIFYRALRRMGVAGFQAAYVGDNPEADVAGARQAGLWSVWKRSSHASEPSDADGVIADLPELIPLIQTLAGQGPGPRDPN